MMLLQQQEVVEGDDLVICVVAMFVFAVLGVFSAKYRAYTKESFACVFNRITLRPCDTGFDQRMKTKVVTKTFKASPKLGKIVYKHFERISWMFTILLVVSLVYASLGVYNIAVYGTCTPDSPGECVLTDTAACGCEVIDDSCELIDASCDCETTGESCICE